MERRRAKPVPNLVVKEFRLSLTPAIWMAFIAVLSSIVGTVGYVVSRLIR